MGKFWGDEMVWDGENGVLDHNGSISDTRKDIGKVTMEGQRTNALSYGTIPIPTASTSPRL